MPASIESTIRQFSLMYVVHYLDDYASGFSHIHSKYDGRLQDADGMAEMCNTSLICIFIVIIHGYFPVSLKIHCRLDPDIVRSSLKFDLCIE